MEPDLQEICRDADTIGKALESVGDRIANTLPSIQNLSEYRVVLIWPVADGVRSQRVLQFSRPREGYLLNWDAWTNELSTEERHSLPLREFNRTRLYFDFRVIPVRAADLHRLCLNLERDDVTLGKTYLDRFKQTHLFHILSGSWESYDYNPVRERESQRAEDARAWYASVTGQPTALGRRIAKILTRLDLLATHEKEIKSRYSTVRSDVFIDSSQNNPKKQILELKAFASENTMPSTIKDAIRATLRRHAQFAGFLEKQ